MDGRSVPGRDLSSTPQQQKETVCSHEAYVSDSILPSVMVCGSDEEEEKEEEEEDGDGGDGEELASCRRCSAESAPRTKKAGKLELWHVEKIEHERTASRTDTERHMTDWAQSGGAGVEGVEGRPSLNYHDESTTVLERITRSRRQRAHSPTASTK